VIADAARKGQGTGLEPEIADPRRHLAERHRGSRQCQVTARTGIS